ncbi:hypothetical protein like AT2G27950 [Hibiscus trionum]|uniref:RING-type domain-containing protein n=1 Tax=Hibiscus trionum TaxID=183268 RepID=A0A9W7MS93_HIBTR|nr:hypothetical protein like AT2G27950 [Hibiscus trionum]
MAIAGLHTVSVLENSFRRESQSQSSRRQENGSTRTSSILQMWRELEDKHVMNNAQERGSKRILQQRSGDLSTTDSDSRNGESTVVSENVSGNEFGQWSQDRFGSQTGNADSSNFNCEPSSDLGEVERERVRQIFREWMKNCGRDHTSNVSLRSNSSRAKRLGEAEQERVGTIRECVQMNSQQRGACIQSREAQAAAIGGHIEEVLNGFVVNQNEYRTELVHRGIRKLCGRQALLDMLEKSKSERQTEVQGLSEFRAVSNFAHHKLIQSLLRGRFLINEKRVAVDGSTSIAASESGLSRQNQTVSGLREGSFSILDHSGCGLASSKCSDTPSNTDTKGNRNEQNHVDNSYEVMDRLNDQSEHENGETDLVADVEDISRQEASTLVEECQDESRDVPRLVLDGDGQENIANVSSLETLQNEAGEHSGEASYVLFPQDGDISGTYGLINDIENLEHNLVPYIDGLESASQVEGLQEDQENNDAEWQESRVEHNVLMDGSNEGATDMHHEDGGNEDGSLHETTGNQLEGSYIQEPVTVRRTYTFYLLDDDNVQSMELRELLNRRSVSSLLHSGFRESLDQFVQSYVERQNDPSFYLELNETSATSASVEQQDVEQQSRDRNEGQRDAEVPSPRMPYMQPLWDQDSYHRNETSATPASVEQDVEQQSRDRNEGQRDDEVPPLVLPLPRMPYTQPLWDRNSYHHYHWAPDDVYQRPGIEWDIINDLRVDMARLQQRMNSMQRMLGACMEMQLELQRSIRQEVSAALNHSAGSQGMIGDSLSKDAHNWDNVRKGICCICSKGNIDSLLYRCGHMCACSRCANELFQRGAKCPMCRAPIIEVIRAYSIQ